jgi:hypothetical protein
MRMLSGGYPKLACLEKNQGTFRIKMRMLSGEDVKLACLNYIFKTVKYEEVKVEI